MVNIFLTNESTEHILEGKRFTVFDKLFAGTIFLVAKYTNTTTTTTSHTISGAAITTTTTRTSYLM